VIDVTAAIVTHHRADVLRHGFQIGDQFTRAFRLEFRLAGQRGVDVVDVGGVVLAVVNFHGAGIDVGFERGVGVSKIGKVVGHDGGDGVCC